MTGQGDNEELAQNAAHYPFDADETQPSVLSTLAPSGVGEISDVGLQSTSAGSADVPTSGVRATAKRKRRSDTAGARKPTRGLLEEAWQRELAAIAPRDGVTPLPYRPTDYAEAFAWTAPQRAALAPQQVKRGNVRAGKVVAQALAAAIVLDSWRPSMLRLPMDITPIDNLCTLARAFSYSDSRAMASMDQAVATTLGGEIVGALTPKQRLRNLRQLCLAARHRLHSDVTNLINQEALPAGSLENLKGGGGYYDLGSDIMALASLIRDGAPTVRQLATTTDAALVRYSKLAQDIIDSSARTPTTRRTAAQALAWDDRARAFTLLWLAYRQAQRALSFIIWDRALLKDVLPTLLSGGGRKR